MISVSLQPRLAALVPSPAPAAPPSAPAVAADRV